LSLRTRLTLVFASAMAVVLAGVAVFVYGRVHADLRGAVDMGLRSRAQVIAANASHAGTRIGGGPRQNRLIDPDEAFAQVLSASGEIVETTPGVRGAPLIGPPILRSVRGATFLTRTPAGLDSSRLLVIPLRSRSSHEFAVVGATLSNSNDAAGTLARQLEIALPVALLASSLVAWLLAGATLRPVERMRRQADAITATDLARRLPVPTTGDTLARLAVTLNATFDRLQAALEGERRFVDEASHELRTPLTILKAEVDSALAAPRSREDLTRALVSARQEVDHLVRIAEGLLVLARVDNGHIPIRREEVSLPALLRQSRAAFLERAVASGVTVDVEAPDATVQVDHTRVRQALDNLLDNALRHTPTGGTVRIRATVSPGLVLIAVADTGAGFTNDMLNRAFLPFASTADESHGGAGLGLAIVAAIAHAHAGDAKAENLPGGGAHIAITLADR
jgi:two-component system, OmpR family, sensor kinase